MIGGLVPDGPLHPVDAAWAVAVGLALGLSVRRRPRPAPVVIGGGVVALVAVRPTVGLLEGVLRHDHAVWVGVAAAVVAALVVGRPVDSRTGVLAAAVACGPVWALVPDTEAPLLVGLALVVAGPMVPAGAATRSVAVPAILPVLAAAVGTLGRPDRFAPAVAAAGTVGLATVVALTVAGLRQRAGTPRTVRPAGTSSTTTAPAPTTAP